MQAIIDEIEKQKPIYPPHMLSKQEKDRLIQRGFLGLYRWYLDRSQSKRNWNPDRSFDWRNMSKTHSPEMMNVLDGYYAVEQFAPDYTSEVVKLTRESYGRSQFHLRWGSEEEKHSDSWRNSLLFSGRRSVEWIEEYTSVLREKAWTLPFDDLKETILYTVLQERATQLNYMGLLKIARGESEKPQFADDTDPVLAEVAQTIAVDEAAHYNFFLEGSRLFLYYYPEETLTALGNVLKNFMMPAHDLLPEYDKFVKAVYDAGIFDFRTYSRDVVQSALKNMGVNSLKGMHEGIARLRQVPAMNGEMRETTLMNLMDFSVIEGFVESLFARIGQYESEIGFTEIAPTNFAKHSWAISS